MWLRASGTLISTKTFEEFTWEDGVLTGSRVAVTEFRNTALTNEGKGFGPHEGPYNYTDHILNPWSVVGIIEQMYIGYTLETTASSDFPTRPPIPEGAIG